MSSQNNNNSTIPIHETYWSLVSKADKKFSKIRDLPYYQRTRYDAYFYKVFKVYTHLWQFQQQNRQKLVESGLKRWEIGEIASRIGQLYFGHYMRTSDRSYLSESFIFYEAILSREYFKDISIASKQLRFIARFLTVCLLLGKRDLVYHLVNMLKMLLDECKRTFQGQEADFKEWKVVIQEIVKFLKADTAFMNIRPLRYSVVLDLQPDSLPQLDTNRKLRLKDALLCSYHPNEVKFSELTLDTFRMLQSLEWEPSGSFYQPNTGHTSGGISGGSQNGTSGPSRVNQDITDPTLPPNPRKAILYRPSITHFIAVLGTICEELPPDGVLLIYVSASGSSTQASSSVANSDNISREFQFHSISSDATSSDQVSTGYEGLDDSGYSADCLNIGPRAPGGLNFIYPSDFLPFTRRPLFLVIDSKSGEAFKVISGAEKGEPAAMLISPTTSLPFPALASSRQPSGSLFTSFLTAPLQSFILLLGFAGADIEKDLYNKAEQLLQSSLNLLGSSLVAVDDLDPVWAQIITDPFLRRLLLRFIFCRAVLSLYSLSFNKMEFQPECLPCLPEVVWPNSSSCQSVVMQLADLFGGTNKFMFS